MPVFTFFAVDKGNMTLIQFSNGINMMVDCRRSAERLSPLEYLREKKMIQAEAPAPWRMQEVAALSRMFGLPE